MLALVIGLIFGVYPFIDELLPSNEPPPAVKRWETYGYDVTKYQEILKNSADFDALLSLTPPADNANIDEWFLFLQQLNNTPLAKRHDNSGATTPLMAWYAYTAKHKPEALIQAYGKYGFHQSKLDVLIRYGLLQDWDKFVDDPSDILLDSSAALAAYAYYHGTDQAKGTYKTALFQRLQLMDTRKQRIDLENIPFIMGTLSNEEVTTLSQLLLNRPIIIDPRDIKLLTATKRFKRNDLLALMRRHAYQSKTMSSYKLHGVQLGAAEYINDVIPDMTTNAKKPTNFYCAACVLAVATDGLIGEPLLAAFQQGLIKIEPEQNNEYTLSLTDELQPVKTPHREIQQPKAHLEWSQ